MQVKLDSSVDHAQQPYLHAWDTAARQYHTFFEAHKKIAADNLLSLRSSTLTNWRSPIQLRSRYQALDSLSLRQQLGDISQAEVSELNRVMGVKNNYFTKGNDEPAKLVSYNTVPLFALLGVGGAFGLWGKFAMRYNWLWLLAAPIPFLAGLAVNRARQPQDDLQNAYRYLLAKRSATCEMEKNASKMSDLAKVKAALGHSDTLYDLEASLVDRIASNNF